MKLVPAFLFFVFSYLSSFAQLVGDMDDESRLYAETKQVNQFFRRFNGEENKRGDRLYSGDRQFRAFSIRKSYLRILFDLENSSLNQELAQEFVSYVNSKSDPVFLDFHEDSWFAQVNADFYYKGELKPIILFLKLEQERLGYKWVISSIYFKLFEDYFINDTTYTKKFLHPMSHELDFMNMRRIFSNSDSVQQYMKKEFKPDYLTMFLYEIKKGNLQFVSVKDLKFHFFQVPGWYFEVSYFNRKGNNTGWLISNLVKYKPEEEKVLKDFILYEN
jgi:hypothetical protein